MGKLGSSRRGLLFCISMSALGCGKATPDKVCSHAVEISPLVPQKQCADELGQFQRAEPEKFDAYAKCAMAAKNVATLGECNGEFHPSAAAEAAEIANKPAPSEEAKGVLTDVLKSLAGNYKQSSQVCPTAKAVPASLTQLVPSSSGMMQYQASLDDWKNDPGWSCYDPRHNAQWLAAPLHWQYEFKSDAGKSVTVYARGSGGGGKKKEISATATVENGALEFAPGFTERIDDEVVAKQQVYVPAPSMTAATIPPAGDAGVRVSLRQGEIQVSGSLAPDVLQRLIRKNAFDQFRTCYQDGLRTNPKLAGRVSVKFVIDTSGSVSSASDAASAMSDKSVISCVVRKISTLAFPKPEGGIVTVVYPITFSLGE